VDQERANANLQASDVMHTFATAIYIVVQLQNAFLTKPNMYILYEAHDYIIQLWIGSVHECIVSSFLIVGLAKSINYCVIIAAILLYT